MNKLWPFTLIPFTMAQCVVPADIPADGATTADGGVYRASEPEHERPTAPSNLARRTPRRPPPIVSSPERDLAQAQAACRDSSGKWVCQASSIKPVTPEASVSSTCTACTVSAWYGDLQNRTGCASDSNSGTSTGCDGPGIGPVLHLCNVLAARYGSTSPKLPQFTQYNFLSDEDSSDQCTLTPWVTDPPDYAHYENPLVQGAFGQTYLTSGTGGVGNISAVGLQNRAAGASGIPTITVPGVDWSTACGGSCACADVHDTTAGTQFWINADLGSGKASISQQFVWPVTPTGPLQPPSIGDEITVGRPVYFWTSYLHAHTPVGGMSVNEVTLGIPGYGSEMHFGPNTYSNEVAFASTTSVFNDYNDGQLGPLHTSPCFRAGGYSMGTGWYVGGISQGDLWLGDNSIVDGDFEAVGNYLVYQGDVQLENFYLGSTNSTEHARRYSVMMYHNNSYDGPYWWGPGGWNADYGAQIRVQTGYFTFTKNDLTKGTKQIDETTKGCSFNPGSTPPAYTCDITPTQATIDSATNGTLLNPQTGSGYSSAY